MTRRLAASLALSVACLAAGCSRPAGEAGGSAAPRAAGAIRFDLAADPSNLNPLFLHQDAASVEQQVARLAFLPFIDLDDKGRMVPELLDRIPTRANGGISADGRTITYHLRRGVRWSDGVPVSTADVVWTLAEIMDRDNPVPSREGYDLIDRTAVIDAYRLQFHLRRAWAPAAATLFSYGFRPQFVLPEHIIRHQTPMAHADFNAAPAVGDGPYTFVAWRRGESLRYKPNPLYWRGAPQNGGLDIRIIPDPQTNLVMLRSGALDFNLIAPVQKVTLAGARSLSYTDVPTAVIAGAVFNLRHAPLNDVRVRRAIAMSVNREGISAKITLGHYPPTGVLQPRFSWAYDASVQQPRYDPRAADAMFDAAGWRRGADGIRTKRGKPLAIVYVQFPESTTGVRVATYIQAQLRERGVPVEIKSISNAQLFLPSARGGTLASGDFDMAYVPFTMGADPDDSSVLGCRGASNFMRYCNPAVDALERAALQTPVQSERKVLYGRIQRIVAADVPILYLFDAQYIYAYRSNLRGFAPNAFLPTWNAARWALAGS